MTEPEKDRVQRLMARGVDQFLAQLLGMHWPEGLPILNAKLVDAAAAWGDVADAINAALDRIERPKPRGRLAAFLTGAAT